LLIASFVYNFNNYLLIEALTTGDPPIPGSTVPTGYTDILINYTYNSAFTTTRDYGYASAITIVIFIIVATITLFQYQYTKTWEEVGENV
jgi:ABC-type sugar transport system permease subunit